MLKTNSKKARENTLNYIFSDSEYLEDRANYDDVILETKEDYAAFVWRCFIEEYGCFVPRLGAQKAFEDWAQGLALGGMFCYYYNVSAVDTLAGILEETPEQAGKYTEEQAEKLLTYLIFREAERNKARKLEKKITFDFWRGGSLEDVANANCFFNDTTCTYSGWMYNAAGEIIGDYSAKDSVIIEKYFPGMFEEKAA